ncbi:hypothetical protein MKW98_024210 [Papaver atlanticum]|uniref:Wall-associated receptor kinase galacturonan-binding domain-containing protein n=1 Tax=Papaver atlanticum TaxID=357466 RepID=A0AAD4XN14_9MAGN|nr:hypothetical protein MKW98_024210 [Papaver atlanticum]
MFPQLLFQLMIIISCWITVSSSSLSSVQTKPGCQPKCGDVNIPYPFGIISSSLSSPGGECFFNDGSLRSYGFSINYNTTYNPPKPFLASATGKHKQIATFANGSATVESDIDELEILSITESEVRVKTWQTTACYDKPGPLLETSLEQGVLFNFTQSPFTFSNTKNRVFAVGCDAFGVP